MVVVVLVELISLVVVGRARSNKQFGGNAQKEGEVMEVKEMIIPAPRLTPDLQGCDIPGKRQDWSRRLDSGKTGDKLP